MVSLRNFFGPKTLYFVCGKVYKDNTYANRCVHWFAQHELPVVPITPTLGLVDLHVDYITKKRAPDLPTLKIVPSIPSALQELENDKATNIDFDSISVNFVTPPHVTLEILKELKTLPVKTRSCWFQPGSWDYACLQYAENDLGLGKDNVINDCILVKGFANMSDSDLKPFSF